MIDTIFHRLAILAVKLGRTGARLLATGKRANHVYRAVDMLNRS